MRRLFTQLAAVLFLLIPLVAQGQGLLVDVAAERSVRLPRPGHPGIRPPQPRPMPVPQSSYKIKQLSIEANLVDQVARVQVSQSFVNTGSRQMEVCFIFPLPYDGAIDSLTLMVDGKEYEAKLLEAKAARGIYEAIVRKNKDPALLEWMGTGMFKTSVFPVPAGATRTVTLRYSQLCRRNEGLTEFVFPLSTAKYTSAPIESVDFRVTMRSDEKIKNVYSPTHSINIRRPTDELATVTYSLKQQVPSSDFRLFYDVGRGKVGAKLLSYRPNESEDGYFMLLASPEIKAAIEDRVKKTVVFVVDRSGSMQGKKIAQARGALKYVLNNLREGDTFNIVAYDSAVESFRPELQRFNEESRKSALGFIEGIYAGGSTNISGALKSALSQLKDSSRPNYVIFLTDGLPTAGEVNEMKIVAGTKDLNSVSARIFSFGVGYDVNSRLLDKLSRKAKGQSFYVQPDEDIEDRVSRMYTKIASPRMTDVTIKVDVEGLRPEDGSAINRVYPAGDFDLFAGDQLVVVGRYKKPGAAKIVVSGKVGGKPQSFDFPATLVTKSHDESHVFVEKLWAIRRIGEIIDQIDLVGKNSELVAELVQLSTKHGILTPYTSFLADETSNIRNRVANRARADSELDSLEESAGESAFQQRAGKNALRKSKSVGGARGFGSGGFGGGPTPTKSTPTARASGAPGSDAFGDADVAKKAKREANVLRVGRKTFFRRKDRWVDADVTEKLEKEIKSIERYGDAYFKLLKQHGDEVAKYLAIDGDVTVEIDGQAYSF